MLRLIMFSATLSGIQIRRRRRGSGERGDRADGGEAVLRGGLDGVADVQVVRPGLGEVLEGVHGRVAGDVRRLPAPVAPRRSAGRSRPGSRRVVAEELPAARQQLAPHQLPLVVVPDLVPEMAQHRPVGLAELLAHLLPVGGRLSARSMVITPLACPMTTFSSTLLSRSKARPFSASSCLPTIGKPSASSSTTRWRLARPRRGSSPARRRRRRSAGSG